MWIFNSFVGATLQLLQRVLGFKEITLCHMQNFLFNSGHCEWNDEMNNMGSVLSIEFWHGQSPPWWATLQWLLVRRYVWRCVWFIGLKRIYRKFECVKWKCCQPLEIYCTTKFGWVNVSLTHNVYQLQIAFKKCRISCQIMLEIGVIWRYKHFQK